MNGFRDSRDVRSRMAGETLKILEQGWYRNSLGEQVILQGDVDNSIRESVLYSPKQLPALKEKALSLRKAEARQAVLEVTDESTLEAARRLVEGEGRGDAVCLNFASAKNPGGGFLGGSQAQEESLARSSALYPCISQMTEMYSFNRSLRTCLYSHYMIHSPGVPVFRNDKGELLEAPYRVSMITAPAVNAGVVREREPEHIPEIGPVMLERIRYICSVAALHGHRTVILGAYGCGVFRNDPHDVARQFKQVLVEEGFGGLFDRIVFAVMDRSRDKGILHAFMNILGV